jgi:hypothetical protein
MLRAAHQSTKVRGKKGLSEGVGTYGAKVSGTMSSWPNAGGAGGGWRMLRMALSGLQGEASYGTVAWAQSRLEEKSSLPKVCGGASMHLSRSVADYKRLRRDECLRRV